MSKDDLFKSIPTSEFTWEELTGSRGTIKLSKSSGAMIVVFHETETGIMYIIHEEGFEETPSND